VETYLLLQRTISPTIPRPALGDDEEDLGPSTQNHEIRRASFEGVQGRSADNPTFIEKKGL